MKCNTLPYPCSQWHTWPLNWGGCPTRTIRTTHTAWEVSSSSTAVAISIWPCSQSTRSAKKSRSCCWTATAPTTTTTWLRTRSASWWFTMAARAWMTRIVRRGRTSGSGICLETTTMRLARTDRTTTTMTCLKLKKKRRCRSWPIWNNNSRRAERLEMMMLILKRWEKVEVLAAARKG